MDALESAALTPVIPGLEFIDRIGEGGIADVWRARWDGIAPYTGERAPGLVAVKVLREPDRKTLLRRFLREGHILERVRLPGLVRCFHVVLEPQPALILELLEGESLDRRIARGPLPQAEARALAVQLLGSLMNLHDQGIIHRDLKASNIWVVAPGPDAASEPKVVLVDLGLAVDSTDPLTSTLGVVVGTHSYMAPEQLSGASVDLRADLYSLGITLYEALCGQRPYQARGRAGYLQAHRSGRAAPIATRCDDVDPTFAACVDRLLARDPADRPASAAVALALLNLAPVPIIARTLCAPRSPIGREGVRGAVLGALHADRPSEGGAGLLQLVGPVGSGLAAAAEQARRLADAEGVEHVTLRLVPHATREWALRELCRSLDGWTGAVSPTTASIAGAVQGLSGEARGKPQVMMVIEGLSGPRIVRSGLLEWVAELSAATPTAVIVVTTSEAHMGLPGVRLDLRPLTPEETATVVARMLDTPAPPIGLVDAIQAATGGMPGLTVMSLKRIAMSGALTCTGADESGAASWEWDARTDTLGHDPRAQRRVLRQLSEASRRVLDVLTQHDEPVALDTALGAAQSPPEAIYPLLRHGLASIDANDRVWLRHPAAAAPADGEPSLTRVWNDLPLRSWRELHAALERTEAAGLTPPERERALHILVEAEALLYYGRPLPPRLLDAVRELGGEWSAGRAWVLGLRALRQGDAVAARRRLLRIVTTSPDLSARLSAEAVRALTDLDWRSGKRIDASRRARQILADPSLSPVHRATLRVDVAGRHASALSLQAAVHALAEAQADLEHVPRGPVHTLLELASADVMLRAGRIEEAVGRISVMHRAADLHTPWSVRAGLGQLLGRLRRAQNDLSSAHAVHVRAEEDAARADDLPLRAYHAGMAAALSGDVHAATGIAGQLDSRTVTHLRADLLTVCARRARDAGLFQLAEASARASGDRTLLLHLLYSVRGPGAREEAAEMVNDAIENLYSPLREAFLALPEVHWARSVSR